MSTKQIKEILPKRNEEKGEKSSEEEDSAYSNVDVLAASVFAGKSESMPALSTFSVTLDDNEEESEGIAPMSDSSVARERQMKRIVARIGPSTSDILVTAEDISEIDVDNSQELRKMDPQTALPVLQSTTDVPSCKEVTFNDHVNQRKPRDSVSKEDSQKSLRSRERGSLRQIQENDDLIDIAENRYPSVKSFYIPPTPDNAKELSSSHKKQQYRVAEEALMKIDGELGPLQHQLNQIRGKMLALNLVSSVSCATSFASGSISSYLQRDRRTDSNLSSSLIPTASSSCYKCHRNRTFDLFRPRISPYYQISGTSSSFVGHSGIASTSNSPRYQEPIKADKMLQAEFESGKEFKETSTVTSNPQLRVISVNTSVEERLIASLDAAQGNSKDSDSSFEKPRDQGISASLAVMGSDGNSRARYMNYTRVDSQTSLMFKDQDAMTSFLDYRDFPEERIKELKDFDVQCSGLSLKEIVVKRSVETLMKPSESTVSSKSSVRNDLKKSGIQLSKTDEKVVIVPILFTDGIPEPPKAPLFNFSTSRCHLPRANHHLIRLDKKSSSVTQNSLSGNSGDSSMMETSFINQKLTGKPSEMSSSCTRTNSSLRYMNPSTIKTTTDYHHHHHHHHHQSRRRHTHSNKAHSEPTKGITKRVIHGMRSSPEEFLCDT